MISPSNDKAGGSRGRLQKDQGSGCPGPGAIVTGIEGASYGEVVLNQFDISDPLENLMDVNSCKIPHVTL